MKAGVFKELVVVVVVATTTDTATGPDPFLTENF
jgi:hypothetical protein